MPNYIVKLTWEITVKNADNDAQAIELASEQLYDDLTKMPNELMWNVKIKK